MNRSATDANCTTISFPNVLLNYLRTALRALARHRAYAAVNVFGLAFGLACCLLIGLFVLDEFSYDRFHQGVGDMHIVGDEARWADQEWTSVSTPGPLAPAIASGHAAFEDATRLTYERTTFLDAPSTQFSAEAAVLFADSNFFGFFSGFELLRGDPATALAAPYQVVLTARTAEAIFGEQDPLGEVVESEMYTGDDEPQPYEVVGIVAEAPRTSSIQFDALASFSTLAGPNSQARWGMSMYQTFFRTAPGVTSAEIDTALMQVYRAEAPSADTESNLFGIPFAEYYLHDISQQGGFSGSARYVRLFSFIALLVLLVALINYMNLATARASLRAREVGVRKTLGASRGQLAAQFLVEALVLTGLAFALGLVLTELSLPVFNAVFEKELSLGALLDARVALGLVALLAVVGLVAGSYPALYLSRFRPVEILRGQGRSGTGGGATWLRRGLVVVQFAATIALLVACFVVVDQLRFARETDLGFQPEQVLEVEFQTDAMQLAHEAIKAEVLGHLGALTASATSGLPHNVDMRTTMPPYPDAPEADYFSTYVISADADYATTLGLSVEEGRDFDWARPTDEAEGLLVNRSFAERMALQNPVNHEIERSSLARGTMRIIGVLGDFQIGSLRSEVAPAVIRAGDPNLPWPRYSRLAVRFDPAQTAEVAEHVAAVWERFGAKKPAEIQFADDAFAEHYETDRKLAQVFGFFATVAIVIAALGLFGLAAFAAERRTKEIGVRKVLGASTGDVVGLLSKEFLVLRAVAFAIAAPVAYLVMRRWLDGFAYHVGLSPLVFAGAGLAAAVVALAVVSAQAIRAARRDPVLALRAE
jgi:putative ABC transport system permease protein